MNILSKITLKSLKLNKKRTIGTIVGIILSVALICAIAGMGTSFRATLVSNAVDQTGYNHLIIEKTNEEIVNDLKLNRDIKSIYTTYDLGFSKFTNEKEQSEEYLHILSLGQNELDDVGAKIVEGRMPKNSSELVVSEVTLRNSNIHIGDEITLDVGRRKVDNYELDESNPYNEGMGEYLDNVVKKTYKIVGSITGSKYYYNFVGFTAKETNKNHINAYIILKNPFKYKDTLANLFGKKDYSEVTTNDFNKFNEEYGELKVNRELLRWEVFSFSDSTITMIITILAIVIGIVVVTSVFCIRNSFAISTTEKIKMFGMLSSVGATKKQIKKCVIKEGLILSLIGIPFGVLSGILADFIIIKVVNKIAYGLLLNGSTLLIFSINVIPIILSIVLGLITIYLSSISSAYKASRVSPIENLRNTNEIKIKSKKLKTPKIINKLFKTGGVLAYKNLKRSKKKYRTTVISLTVSIFVFITMNAFINEGIKSANTYYTNYDYNIKLVSIRDLSNNDINKIKDLENYKLFSVNYDSEYYLSIPIDNVNKNLIDMGIYDVCSYDETKKDEHCKLGKDVGISIIALDHESYQRYLKKLKVNKDNTRYKGILVNDYLIHDEKGVAKFERIYSFNKGDKITGKLGEDEYSIEVAYVTDKRPVGLENTYYNGGYLIVDYNDFGNIELYPDEIMIDTDNHLDIKDKIKDMYPNIVIDDIEEEARAERAVIIIISIFLYGFIGVITLIGVTNIFNTITSNMELRQKEFAMLKSIGMTKREFNRMINLETIFYSTKSLIYGISLGIIGSYLIHQAFGLKTIRTFILPMGAIMLSICFVFILVFVIMRYSMRKINKQNIIETIRKDNI